MRRYLFIFVWVGAAVGWFGCQKQEILKPPQTSTESKPNPKPSTNNEPLLLLDDEPNAVSANESEADNSRCFVCHVNYMQEDIAITHTRAGIGCPSCHGQSDAHIADESWASGGNGT